MLSRHPLLFYFAFAYAISWGGIGGLIASRQLREASASQDFILVFAAMALGPFLAGIIMTLALDGREGFSGLWKRLIRWRVGVRWYTVALGTTPMVLLPVLWGLATFVGQDYAPRFQIELFAFGLLAGFFEEVGWSGFATHRLLTTHRWPVAGLALGVPWAAWHALADFDANHASMGTLWFIWFAVFWLAALPAYRLLMTWCYERTRSVFLGVLMHAAYTGWLFVLSPDLPVAVGLVWQGAFAVGLWLIVALLVISQMAREGGHAAREA